MAANADLRQQIILEMQALGADAASLLAHALREVQQAFEDNIHTYQEGEQTAQKTVATFERLARVQENLIGIQAQAVKANEELAQSAQAIDVGFYKLALTAIKFKDSLEAVAAAQAELDKMAAGDAQRARIDALAREERKLEAAVRAVAAAEEHEHDVLEQLNKGYQDNVQNVGMATRATREQIQALKDMGIIQDQVTTKVAAGKGQFGGFATAAEQAADHSQRMGYAMLNASYLIQDMQYGVGAVANNIGIMTLSMSQAFPKMDAFITKIGVPGGATGMGAGIMFAAVAADLLYNNWGAVVSAMSGGLPPKLHKDAEELEADLKRLGDIRVKTQLDYSDIRIARAELERLQEAEAAYDRIKKQKTEEQQKRGEVITKAIVEGGGGTDFTSSAENISATIADIMTQESPEIRKQQEFIADQRRRLASPTLDDAAKNRASASLVGATSILNDMTESIQKQARGMVGMAGEGKKAEAGQLAGFFGAHEARFAARGVDTLRFGAGMEMAEPKNLFSEERRKIQVKQDEKARKAEEEAQLDQMRINDRLKGEEAKSDATRLRARAEMKKVMDDNQRDEARKEEGEAVWQIQQAQRLDREKKQADAKAERERIAGEKAAPAREKRQDIASYGQEFQARAGAMGVPVNAGQQATAGRMIQSEVAAGTDVNTAMDRTFTKLIDSLQQAQMNDINRMARIERLDGVVNGFWQQQQRMARQLMNGGKATPPNAVHQPGF